MGPLVVNVADLVHRPGAHRDEHLRTRLDAVRVVDTTVPSDEDVAVEVRLESVHDGILATGTVVAPWAGECRRCLRRSRCTGSNPLPSQG